MDIAVALADLDAAPAVALAPVDAANDAGLCIVADLRAVVRRGADGSFIAGLHDRCPTIAEKRHEHPPLRSVRVLDQPPRIVFLEHANRQVAALVEPYAGIILAGSGAGHRLPARDRRPIWRRLLLRCGRSRDGG